LPSLQEEGSCHTSAVTLVVFRALGASRLDPESARVGNRPALNPPLDRHRSGHRRIGIRFVALLLRGAKSTGLTAVREPEGTVGKAIVGAKILIVVIEVIASFSLGVSKTIAARVLDAVCKTSIFIAVVAIIAVFALVDDIVATMRFLAVQATCVGHIRRI
jgi:hypothetical protein